MGLYTGFLNSPSKIYQSIQLHDRLLNWDQNDIYGMLEPLRQLNYSWNPVSNRMEVMHPLNLGADTPWCHADAPSTKFCNRDHTLIFNHFNVIHPRCLECWKTVVTPKTFTQLMQLEELQNKMSVSSKCGIELRDYTPKHYGGYFYSDSIDEGRKRYDIVCDAVRDAIGDDIAKGVILKRGCTEFELTKGPSPYWYNTTDDEKILQILDMYVDTPRSQVGQADFIKNHIRLKWVLWAHMNGDMTYQDLNDGNSLFPGYVSYHEGDLNGIKRDLAVAKAQAKAGIKPEVSDAYIHFTQDFADSNNIQMKDLVHSLGMNNINPLGDFSVIKEVPDELKGEQDELT